MLARRTLRTLRSAASAHSPAVAAMPMRSYRVPRNEIDFICHEVHELPKHYGTVNLKGRRSYLSAEVVPSEPSLMSAS